MTKNVVLIHDAAIDEYLSFVLHGRASSVSDLAHQAYALVSGEPFYCLWDLTATMYLARPELYSTPLPMRISVDTSANKMGAVREDPNGREVRAVLAFKDLPGFYDSVAEMLRDADQKS